MKMKKNGQLWASTAVFLLFFTLSLTSLTQKSPTFDEQGYITRGLGYLRGDNRHMRVGHPLGLNALNAAFLINDATVTLPVDDPSWQKTSFHRPSELFLWEIGNDVERTMFLARLPTVFLGLLLTAVSARWTFELTRNRWAGLLTLTLLAFDPNILAHSRFTTTDLGLAAFTLLAGYTLWRFLKRPSFPRALLAGITFGLLQNTKFTAGLFVPLFALVILVGIVRYWRLQRTNHRALAQFAAMLLLVYPLAGFFTLWATYGFQIGSLPANLPSTPQLSGLTVPLAHHLEQLLDIGGRLQKSTPAFLLGDYSDTGWPHYFPIAFLLKTPLPTLILLTTSFIISCYAFLQKQESTSSKTWISAYAKMTRLDIAALLIPPLGYFAIALTTEINLGYRHLLPILPYFAIFIGAQLPLTHRLPRLAIAGLMGWLIAISLWIHPHYLAYFNVFAGGADNGWHALVDSNIDWGQDLGALKGWMDENEVDQVYLSYFGEARPDYYDINYIGLDSWPPRLMNPETRPFYPPNPAPGIYAISATMLQGVMSADHDQFATFRDRDPIAKLGYSIFLYEIESIGDPINIALGNVQLDNITTADFDRFNSNDIHPRWFDGTTSLLLPSDGGWLMLGESATWAQAMAETASLQTGGLQLFSEVPVPIAPINQPPPIAQFSQNNGELGLLAVEMDQNGRLFNLTSQWQQNAAPHPAKLFIHAISDDGTPSSPIIAQWDGLGADWASWQTGDLLWQAHTITLPANAPTGKYTFWIGVYNPETGDRWQSEHGDRHFIGEIELP